MTDNIVKFPGTEEVDFDALEEFFGKKLDLDAIFEGLKERELDDIIVIGSYDNNDNSYFASTNGNPAHVLWQLKKAEHMLMLSYFSQAENPYDEDE